ncbi:hypothetical protein [Streptomyces sp. TRM64462]|nr:hypothetical protein [Streptomyces sp. TRM64462]
MVAARTDNASGGPSGGHQAATGPAEARAAPRRGLWLFVQLGYG